MGRKRRVVEKQRDLLVHTVNNVCCFHFTNKILNDSKLLFKQMHRRNIRLRREYLYRKSLEGDEKEKYEKKRQLRQAIEEGKALPTELRKEEKQLREEIELEDSSNYGMPPSSILVRGAHSTVFLRQIEKRAKLDDEYATAGVSDPLIMLTTSREPSSRLAQFVKVIAMGVLSDVSGAEDHLPKLAAHEPRVVHDEGGDGDVSRPWRDGPHHRP
jgi:hypothetical protein